MMRRFLGYIPAVRGVFATTTLRQSSVTFLGTAINGLLGAGFYILAARVLGPAQFGLLAVAIAVLTLTGDIADLGTDTGLVRFVAKYLAKQRERALRFLKLALEVKVIVGLLVGLLGWFLAPFLANFAFAKPSLIYPLRLALLGVLGALLFAFSTSAFQAYQRFWSWSGIQVTTNSIRLLVIVFLWYIGSLDLSSAMTTYVALPFIGFLMSLFFLPRELFFVPKAFKVAREYFHYSKWVALFTLLAAFSARLDTFISARLLPATEVGYYAAATQLVVIVPQIIVALGTVVAPKMAGMGRKTEFISYLKKTQVLVLVLAALGILAIPVVIFLIPILYGSAYALAVPPLFVVLFLGMLLFLIAVPVHNAVFYYFGYPKLFVYVSLGHLAIIAILGYYLISQYGVMGAATTVLIGQIFNFVVPAVWVIKQIRKFRN